MFASNFIKTLHAHLSSTSVVTNLYTNAEISLLSRKKKKDYVRKEVKHPKIFPEFLFF